MLATVEMLASAADVSRQAIEKALKRIINGESLTWRGHQLVVRVVNGRGGASGRNYLVDTSSLPSHIERRCKELELASRDTRSVRIGGTATIERNWWVTVMGPALKYPKGSSDRAAAIVAIASETHPGPNGRPLKLSRRSIYRQLERLETGGLGGLGRFQRSDKGQRRVFISREWDRTVRLPDSEKEKVADGLQRHIRSLVASGATWSQTIELASHFLVKTSQRGFPITDATELLRICQVPKALVQAELHYRKLHRFAKDRKAHEDAKPRIKRSIKGLQPMEWVVVDVHPLDVAVMRADGTEAHPRLLAFLDIATQRCWCELIFLDQRGGVRNVDLIEAFVAMAQHPAFGLPEHIYCDNGSEYNFTAFLEDAIQIAAPISGRRARIVHALPYNASGKPVEQWFMRLESQYLSKLPGYRGGNRMNSRQEAVGRKVAPFAGGFDAFKPAFFGLMRAYEAMPQKRGQLGGKSPSGAFRRHVESGWAAAVMDPEGLLIAFTKSETRDVRQGTITVGKGNRRWTCPELQEFQGDRVTVRVPAYHGFNELLVEDMHGNRIGIAVPDLEFSFNDTRGASASAERQKRHREGLRKLTKDVDALDLAAELIAIGDEAPPVTPNMPRGVVSVRKQDRHPKMIVPQRQIAPSEEDAQREKQKVEEARALMRAARRRQQG